MVILYGTLGFHPEKLLGAIPSIQGHLERVVVYTSTERGEALRESKRALAVVEKTLRPMGVEMEHRTFKSPWDFSGIVERLMSDLEREDRENIVFNLTGGPKTMTVAATITCLFLGIKAIYVPEEEGNQEAIDLPLFRIPYSSVLKAGQRRVLEAIEENEPSSLNRLSETMGRSNATITFHVKGLERMGIIELLGDPRDKSIHIPRLTEAGRIILNAERILPDGESR
jgi:CRISPR locus-related DNA-binding protein